MLKKIKQSIKKQLGITTINEQLSFLLRQNDEILKAFSFNNTIADSKWLRYKSFSPGGWAVDYAFLYTLYRVLNEMKPKSILEFGLGQSSKLIHQYANFYKDVNAITCEHDLDWVEFFKNSIDENYEIKLKRLDLENVVYKNQNTLSYKNIDLEFKDQFFDLIIVDAPFGSGKYSRSQIISLTNSNLSENFCILVDDYDRTGERETGEEIKAILDAKKIKYLFAVYSGSKEHILICSENLKFLTSL
jgi:16S rRNA G966 N2-methylase RsmD